MLASTVVKLELAMSETDPKHSGPARKMSVPWICDHCKAKDFGAEISDDHRTWTRLPTGWWTYPVDHGDAADDDDGCTIMIHAYCSEKCIRASLEEATKKHIVAEGNAPLRATLGDLTRKRRIVGR